MNWVSFWKAVERLDRRYIFLVIGLCIIIPLLIPFHLPMKVSPPVNKFYQAIESLPTGAKVLISCDYDPGSSPELFPMNIAVFDHLFRKDIKFIVTELWPAGPPMVEQALSLLLPKYKDKKRGIDYANLGFKEGKEVVMVTMGNNFADAFPQDYQKTPYHQIPLLKEVRNFSDVSLMINLSAGYPGTKEWVQQVRTRFNIPMIAGCTAVSAPEFYPYLRSGQLDGLLGGLKGAAEYEVLLEIEGAASRGMDSQSFAHLTMVLFIVLGNIAFIVIRSQEKKST